MLHLTKLAVGVRDISHLAPVPARAMNVTATLVMLAIAVVSTALGLLAFDRRDLAPE